jgi:hypothetical protein
MERGLVGGVALEFLTGVVCLFSFAEELEE